MKRKDCMANTIMPEQTKGTRLDMRVDGCKVQLNFPHESENAAVNDIKRMMLSGAVNP